MVPHCREMETYWIIEPCILRKWWTARDDVDVVSLKLSQLSPFLLLHQTLFCLIKTCLPHSQKGTSIQLSQCWGLEGLLVWMESPWKCWVGMRPVVGWRPSLTSSGCESVPEDWQSQLIVPLHKKGSWSICNKNYRGIALWEMLCQTGSGCSYIAQSCLSTVPLTVGKDWVTEEVCEMSRRSKMLGWGGLSACVLESTSKSHQVSISDDDWESLLSQIPSEEEIRSA